MAILQRPGTFLAALPLLLLAACGSGGGASPSASSSAATAPAGHAVVLVSGLATQTPYTTTTEKCLTGLSAGNSVSALRDSLIAAGNQVYTAPAQAGPGQVTSTTGIGPSSDCPAPLPADVTIDTTASIDAGGDRLAAFLTYLREQHGVTAVDLVGHSMGGLFARAAVGDSSGLAGGVEVESLTTLSTPWTGAYPADYAEGTLPLSVCGTELTCLQVLPDYKTKLSEPEGPQGAANAIGTQDLQGPAGWNVAQGPDLDGIPVTLIAGEYHTLPGGDANVWPNDGIVARSSGLAQGISGAPLMVRACVVRPDVHTIDMAEGAGLPWTAAVTWDPVVLTAVAEAVQAPGQSSGASPLGVGCATG
ncbi:MAG: esterase/lipase family protein [Candidatus Nanopelagicales bacterium]